MKKDTHAIYVGKPSLSRNTSSPKDYAEACHLFELFAEVTKILLRKNGISGSQVISQFLSQCNRGQHVLLKSYGLFNKSSLCKICFLYNFIKIFEVDQTQRNGLDYYQLSRLLCSDYPREYIQKAVALLLPQEDPQTQMFKPLQPKLIQNAIYIYMIYTQYIDNLSAYFAQEQELDFLQIYRSIQKEDIKNPRELSKPPFSAMIQALLNLMKRKGLLDTLESRVIFVTQENIQTFIRDAESNCPGMHLKLDELLRALLQLQEFKKIVEENLTMFENSTSWANECHKTLSAREPHETPLNVKKKGTKK